MYVYFTHVSYDVKTTRVVLSVEACSFIQRIIGGHTSTVVCQLSAFWHGYGVLYNRGSCILMRWPDGLDIGPSGLGDLGRDCGLVPYEY